MTGIFTIPPDRCFVITLAQGLWRRASGDPLKLAESMLYLPTRRACRHLREAFLEVTGGRAALLPRLRPLGDADDAAFDFAGDTALDDVPSAIPPLRRLMLLTAMVRKKDPSMPLDQAAALAQALAALLDQAQTEGRSLDALQNIVPENLAQHWQETLVFLELIMKHWPNTLKAEGCIDPAARRDLVLRAQAARWVKSPPPHPVIVAGSTGSVPAAGTLMAAVASLPLGEVILPGLDTDLDEEAWQAVDSTHPQFTMQSWLESVPAKRCDVRVWERFDSTQAPRVRLLREAMRPAEVTEAWRALTPEAVPSEATAGLELLELDHHREEADVIALRLRAALEESGKTAALVTPDRALAQRVGAALARWDIQVDDSAGTSLTALPLGGFLLDVLAAASPSATPVDYLSLLKHPLAVAGLDPAQCRARAREAEIKVWRGVRPADGWRGAARACAKENPELAAWLESLDALFAPITQQAATERSLIEHIDAHIALAEALAATDAENGATRLWRGEAGEAAVAWLAEWKEAAVGLPPLRLDTYARLFRALIDQVSVRPAYGAHPRVAILGLLEARLLHHDLVILGGLNEDVWPPAPPVDPWLSRPMKRDFGLPMPERRVGLSAHDFVQLAAAPQVLLTRARRVGGTPTVPSRFLLQLNAVLQAVGRAGALTPSAPWRAWAHALDAADHVTAMERPAPKPPVVARPTKFSVTEIGLWKRNPYALYAKRILRLKKLDDIDADVAAADKGEMIHKALELFVLRCIANEKGDPLTMLLEEGRKAFAPFADRPQVLAFWWPRFERIAAWVVEQDVVRREKGFKPCLAEAKGVIELADGALFLTGRADRVDVNGTDKLAIIDYKTGGVPSKTEVNLGLEPQLPLLALIAREAGFEGAAAADAAELAYWKITGGKEPAKITAFDEGLEALIDYARTGLEEMFRRFADPATPYEAVPKPRFAPRYDDYAHLARFAEWGRTGGDGA